MKFSVSIGLIACCLLLPLDGWALCVSAPQARLRAQPNPKAKITWVVGRHMPLVEMSRKGRWYRVRDVDGETHWVASSEVTAAGRCVVVKVRHAQLRTGPGIRRPLAEIPTVDRYTAFKRLDAEPEEWYRVEDETGEKYWIAAAQVWRPISVNRIGF